MAKKARRKSAGRGKKKAAAMTKKKKTKATTKKKRAARKPRPASVGGRLSNAYHTVVDTVTGTDRLRNRLEPPGTSESE